jgi:hypothetical protein
MDELRRRQEESNLNTIALLSSHIMSSAAISEANSKLTRTLAVAEQQKSSPSMKLKATDTRSLFLFYGAHNPMDLEPAWHHVDRDIRPALLFDMNLVGMTMEAAFGDTIGPDQPFLVALAEVLRRRKDLKASDIMFHPAPGFPKGAMITLIRGDLSKAEPYPRHGGRRPHSRLLLLPSLRAAAVAGGGAPGAARVIYMGSRLEKTGSLSELDIEDPLQRFSCAARRPYALRSPPPMLLALLQLHLQG